MQVVVGVLALWLIGLSAVDLQIRRLPNVMTLPALFGAVVGVVIHPAAIAGLLLAATVYGVAFWLGGCGGGDVKLAATLGALAGTVMAAAILILLAQVLTLGAAKVRRNGQAQAHGPSLCVAAAVCCGIW